jgi:hypothetical protein
MPKPFAPRADRWLGLLAFALACARSDPPNLKTSLLPGARPTEIRYQLRNVGGRPLALDGVAPICGCAAVTPLPEVLASGASTMLDVRCRAPRGDAATRELRIRTSDPGATETVLPITLPGAGVGPEPAALYLGYVRVGESVVRDVVLPAPIPVASLVAPVETGLAIEPMPARGDAPYGVRVRLTPSAPGVLRATIDLGPAGPLPVVAVVHAGILAFPAEVRAPRRSGGVPPITLVGLGDEPLAIARVDYPPGLGGELRTVSPGRQYRLVLRGRGSGAPGPISLRNAAGAPLLVIPVVGADAGTSAAPPA